MNPSIVLLLSVGILQVLSCDPTNHYTNDKGECCAMCGPGKRMRSTANCKDPLCEDCKDGEYQESYTKEVKCSLHPYCDPNLKLESTEPKTKDRISLCRCVKGHHCINARCTTCVPNRPCEPGFHVAENATQMTDTKCVECPPGTFSSQQSLESRCQPWTECKKAQQEGTTKTDRICEDAETAHHTGLYVSFAFGFACICCLIVACVMKTGKCGDIKVCTDPWKKKFQKENKPLVNEHMEAVKVEEPQQRPVAEENEVKDDETTALPVQEGDSSAENHIDHEVRSEGGQIIQQEQGKEEVLSQTESSCQSCSFS